MTGTPHSYHHISRGALLYFGAFALGILSALFATVFQGKHGVAETAPFAAASLFHELLSFAVSVLLLLAVLQCTKSVGNAGEKPTLARFVRMTAVLSLILLTTSSILARFNLASMLLDPDKSQNTQFFPQMSLYALGILCLSASLIGLLRYLSGLNKFSHLAGAFTNTLIVFVIIGFVAAIVVKVGIPIYSHFASLHAPLSTSTFLQKRLLYLGKSLLDVVQRILLLTFFIRIFFAARQTSR